MDFVDIGFPEIRTKDKFDTVFVIVDRLNGFIQGIPCLKKGLNAEKTIHMFLHQRVPLMGIPMEILSDNDHLITSKFFQTLMDLLGVEHHSSVIYRHKRNGKAERAVRSVVNILRLTLIGLSKRLSLADMLPWACFLQNSLHGMIAGHNPLKIVFGRELLLPGEFPRIRTPNLPVDGQKWFEEIDTMRKQLRDRMTKIHEEETRWYNKDHKEIRYTEGDKVWLKALPKDREKLDPLWIRPCEILNEVQRGRYTMSTTRGKEDHHMDSLKPYTPALNEQSIPFIHYQPRNLPLSDGFTV